MIELPMIRNTNSKRQMNQLIYCCLVKKNFPWERENSNFRSIIYEAKKEKEKKKKQRKVTAYSMHCSPYQKRG